MMAALLVSLPLFAAEPAPPAWPITNELGHHRALITLDGGGGGAPGAAKAVWATVPWQRRRVPDTDATDTVLVAATGKVVANALRAPEPGVPTREATTFVFEPVLAGDSPAPDGPDGWLINSGTAQQSIVSGCSGAQRQSLACWKAADGKLLFSDNSGNDQGWDGATQPGTDTEWIEFDLGQTEPIDRVGVYSVDKSDDPQWFPTHNPGQVLVLARAAPSDPWAALVNKTLPAQGTNVLTGWGKKKARYFRLEILSRLKADPSSHSHSYIKEIRFGKGPPKTPAPAPAPAPNVSYVKDYGKMLTLSRDLSHRVLANPNSITILQRSTTCRSARTTPTPA